jgi:hypothetical protein
MKAGSKLALSIMRDQHVASWSIFCHRSQRDHIDIDMATGMTW